MNGKSFFTFFILFIVLALIQALILNHVVLFNVAICFAFIYFIIRLPLSLGGNLLLTLSFLLGLTVDILSDTAGVNALACTILAVVKKPVFFAYEQHDDKIRDIEPGINSMGWLNYSKFLLSMSAIYSLLALTLEFFSFADFATVILLAAASTVFTFVMLLATDSLIH